MVTHRSGVPSNRIKSQPGGFVNCFWCILHKFVALNNTTISSFDHFLYKFWGCSHLRRVFVWFLMIWKRFLFVFLWFSTPPGPAGEFVNLHSRDKKLLYQGKKVYFFPFAR